jgi:nucleotide-binding universal stress UspA family protein
MNRDALRYSTYRALLEADLTTEDRNKLIEAGMLDKVMDFFGASKDTMQQFGGGIKKMFSDAKYARRTATAKKNIEKELNDLKALAKDAGQDEAVVYQVLNLILKDAGVNAEEVASPPKSEGGSSSSEKSQTPSGSPVKASEPESAVPTIAAAAAQAAGQDPEKAKAQAEEKKVDVPKATQVLAKAVSATAKVDAGKVAKIIDFLVKNNHMLAEGRRPVSFDMLSAAREVSSRNSQVLTLERWNLMAGMSILVEEAAPNDAKKKKFEDVIGDIRKQFKPEDLSDDDILNTIIALDDLDSIEIK